MKIINYFFYFISIITFTGCYYIFGHINSVEKPTVEILNSLTNKDFDVLEEKSCSNCKSKIEVFETNAKYINFHSFNDVRCTVVNENKAIGYFQVKGDTTKLFIHLIKIEEKWLLDCSKPLPLKKMIKDTIL